MSKIDWSQPPSQEMREAMAASVRQHRECIDAMLRNILPPTLKDIGSFLDAIEHEEEDSQPDSGSD